MIGLVNVCCFYLVGDVFYQYFLMFFKNVTGRYECSPLDLWYVGVGLIIDFPVFMSKGFSYSTRIFEFCVLQNTQQEFAFDKSFIFASEFCFRRDLKTS